MSDETPEESVHDQVRQIQDKIIHHVYSELDAKAMTGWIVDPALATLPPTLSHVFMEECTTVTADEMKRLSDTINQVGSKMKIATDELRDTHYPCTDYGKAASRQGRRFLKHVDNSRKARYSQSQKRQ